MTLTMRDGSKKSYVGDWEVFDWTQQNSTFIGQLHCALNALERWLTLEIERGVDVQPYLERLVKEGSSLAFVGLLVNVAKYRPALLSGALLPVLSSEDVYRFDQERVENAQFNFDLRSSGPGQPRRSLTSLGTGPMRLTANRALVEVVGELILRDKTIASFLKTAIATWEEARRTKGSH